MVDTLGLVLSVVVHAANIQDRDGARFVIERLRGKSERLGVIWADGSYAGALVDWVKGILGCRLEIVKRSDDQAGFVVLPHRWIVERTSGWLGRSRRLSKDYEAGIESSEALVLIAMLPLMLKRLDPPADVNRRASRSVQQV